MSYRKWNSKTSNGNSWPRDSSASTNMKNSLNSTGLIILFIAIYSTVLYQ